MVDSGYIVAVIGAGPAGIYATKQLVTYGHEVVLLNKDIKPGGLAEYGIYPTKHKMKEGLRNQFRSILSDPKVHYFGNIEVGRVGDITFDEIRQMGFSAILVTAGAQAARHLGVAGEELKGVYHAKDVVYHYNGLPPYSLMDFSVGKRVAIVGAGNVMLDLAHWLIEMVKVDEVISVIRRGPAEVKFDKKELENVISYLDILALDAELERVAPFMKEVGEDPEESREFYRAASHKAVPHDAPTRFVLKFLSTPKLLVGDESGWVKGLIIEETKLQESHGTMKAIATGIQHTLDVDTVILAIGDQVDQNLGLPFEGSQYIHNLQPEYPEEGISYEVSDPKTGKPMEGIFLAGWSRQASTGLVGIARKDAINASTAVNGYLLDKKPLPTTNIVDIIETALMHCSNCVDYADIQLLESIEQEKAAEMGLEEFKFDTNEKMLMAIRSGLIA
jgi:ferredoxin--NADP+ reductase